MKRRIAVLARASRNLLLLFLGLLKCWRSVVLVPVIPSYILISSFCLWPVVLHPASALKKRISFFTTLLNFSLVISEHSDPYGEIGMIIRSSQLHNNNCLIVPQNCWYLLVSYWHCRLSHELLVHCRLSTPYFSPIFLKSRSFKLNCFFMLEAFIVCSLISLKNNISILHGFNLEIYYIYIYI
jgi:hypothetical protein